MRRNVHRIFIVTELYLTVCKLFSTKEKLNQIYFFITSIMHMLQGFHNWVIRYCNLQDSETKIIIIFVKLKRPLSYALLSVETSFNYHNVAIIMLNTFHVFYRTSQRCNDVNYKASLNVRKNNRVFWPSYIQPHIRHEVCTQ